MRPSHLRLSAASGARALKKFLLPLLMAQLCAAEVALLPRNHTGTDPATFSAPCAHGSQAWQVSLFNGLSFHCAGVLVDKSWVLTAAHCQNRYLWARLGEHHLWQWEGPEQLFRVTDFFPHPTKSIRHPGYSTQTHVNDIMLVKLRSPVKLSSSMKGVTLPSRCERPGTQCTVSGWGTTSSPNGEAASVTQCAHVNLVPRGECEVAYPNQITQNMVCAGKKYGRDSCQGDSGGPVVCNGMLQGLVSWGDFPCGKPSKPGVYTNLCQFTKWIHGTIKSN
uniref:Kallikrein-8-like n=1 Tax=Loxodonta africana TaxID=9785 RepID=G3UDE5_LOXAF